MASRARSRGRPYRRWSLRAVLDELQRIYRAGRIRMTATDLVAAGHSGLVTACCTYARSFARARRLARVPDPGRRLPRTIERWDEDRVISEIRERYRHRKPLNYAQAPSKLRAAATRYFGAWQSAIEAAGYEYARIRQTREWWTRDEILASLREGARAGRAGIGPNGFVTAAVMQTAVNHFGSLREAIAAAGLDPECVLRRVDRSESEIRSALRRLATEQPAMTLSELWRTNIGTMLAHRYGSMQAGLERFGFRTWPKRLVEAAVPARKVIAELRRRHREGRTLRSSDVRREAPRLRNAARKHFGSWWRAMEAAGLRALARPRRTKKQLIADLIARHERGQSLDLVTLQREDPRLLASAEHHFRSLLRALLAARIPPPSNAQLRLGPGESLERSRGRIRSSRRRSRVRETADRRRA